MSREPLPTWFFVLVVVRSEERFLLVHERKHQGWYLPAGRVEPGETLVAAAERETLEEAGLSIEVTGVLRVEHSPYPHAVRCRVIFTARPCDDGPPRSTPNQDTLGARWVGLDEVPQLPLRGWEVYDILAAVAGGAPVYPLSLIVPEGAGWG